MASGAQKQIRFVEEVTAGTTPATDMTELPHRGGSDMTFTPDTQQSDNVRSDLKPSGVVRRGFSISGGWEADFLYGAFDTPIRHAFNSSAWSNADSISAATDIAVANTGNKFTSTTSGKFDSFSKGDIVRFKTAGISNTGWGVVLAVVGGSGAELWIDPDTFDLATEASGTAVTIEHDGRVECDTADKSLSVEYAYTDLVDFAIWRGIKVGEMVFDFVHGTGVSIRFGNLVGLTTDRNTSTYGTGNVTAAPVNPIFRTTDGPKQLWLRGAAVDLTTTTGGLLTTLNLSIASAGRPLNAAGSLGPRIINKNRFVITGTLGFYKNAYTRDLINDLHDNVVSPLFFVLGDNASSPNAYGMFLPEIHFTGGSPTDGGNDSDVMVSLPFIVNTDSVYGEPAIWSRFSTYTT